MDMGDDQWSLPRSHRKTRKPNMMGGRISGSRNRLVKPCPQCGAVRYEKCFQLKTIYSTPRDTYRYYMDTVHTARTKEVPESLDKLTQVGGE